MLLEKFSNAIAEYISAYDNYIPFTIVRQVLSSIGVEERAAQDAFIFGLNRKGMVELSTMLFSDGFSDEDLEAGIPTSECSGDYFYMIVVEEPKQEVQMTKRQQLEQEKAQLLSRLEEIEKELEVIEPEVKAEDWTESTVDDAPVSNSPFALDAGWDESDSVIEPGKYYATIQPISGEPVEEEQVTEAPAPVVEAKATKPVKKAPAPAVSRKQMIEALKPHKKQHPEIKLGGKGSTTEQLTEWYNKYCKEPAKEVVKQEKWTGTSRFKMIAALRPLAKHHKAIKITGDTTNEQLAEWLEMYI